MILSYGEVGSGTRIALLAVVGALVISCGGASSYPTATTPAVTGVGTSSGMVVTQEIGPTGGSVMSSDGHVTVVVPTGALAAPTRLTIEPISAEAPGGIRAWRLGPEGQQFLAPVELVMTYDPQDVTGSAAEALDIGFQKADGTWSVLKAPALDSQARTITATTTHFSDWSLLVGYQLLPPDSQVQIGKTVAFTVSFCDRVVDDSDLTSLSALCQLATGINPSKNWSVNGAPGGTTGTGIVSGQGGIGLYTAPASKPSPATVSVSTEVTTARKPGKIILVSNVTILDQAGWHGTLQYTASGKSSDDTSFGGTLWPTTQNITVEMSGHGTLQMAERAPGTILVSGGSGDWASSRVTTVHEVDSRTSGCVFDTVNLSSAVLSGIAIPPSDSAPGYATLTVIGNAYQIHVATLDGMLSGTLMSSITGTVSGTCSFMPQSSSTPISDIFPTDDLDVDGVIDPKTPNVIKGSKTISVGAHPVRTYQVTWDLSG